ncbi:glycine betaine ABC transporter substrate-binding protein [Paenibacillus gorillae]|uniref:ABC transporter substrate-binding protein n=1 Tax=Paenibacillus gorillae TaxID=1243662 RepID=UPI0004AE745A|nr:glycine betaine ABC transporter substrate-binding protein [Paenibacillus gorillae]
MKNQSIIIASVILLLSLVVSACGNGGSGSASKGTINVGSKNFTEAFILSEAYSLALENAGYKVNRKFKLAGLLAHETIVKGDIDVYPEYTGTALLSILKLPKQSDQQAVYDTVSKAYKDQFNLVWLASTQANNSQGLTVTKEVSDKYGLKTLSQLAELAPQLRLAAVTGFEDREDGLKGLKQAYGGFEFKSVKLFDAGVKYRALHDNEADVTVAFTTDGELTKPNLVLLEDDKHFWPPYYVAPVIKADVLEKNKGIDDILNEVSAKLDTATLQKLNAEVDINKQEYTDVAKQFLQEAGILKK